VEGGGRFLAPNFAILSRNNQLDSKETSRKQHTNTFLVHSRVLSYCPASLIMSEAFGSLSAALIRIQASSFPCRRPVRASTSSQSSDEPADINPTDESLGGGRWLQCKRIQYVQNAQHRVGTWEMVQRTNKIDGRVDGTQIYSNCVHAKRTYI
jgi:hypothetical protein